MSEAAPSASAPSASAAAPGRSLKRNIVHALVGNGVYNICRFLVVVLLAKLASADVLGQYNYANALISPVILFFTFNMRAAMVADAYNRVTFGSWKTTRDLGLLASLVVVAGLCAWKWLDGATTALLLIIAFLALGKIFNQASELCWAMYLKRERLDRVAWSNVWIGVTMLVPFCVTAPIYYLLVKNGTLPAERYADGAAWAALGGAIGALAVYLLYDRPSVRGAPDCNPQWTWSSVRDVFVQVLPLGIVMLIINLCDSVPRLIMEHRTGSTTALGYFSALAYIAMTANLLLIQVGIASANRLAQHYNRNFRLFLRLAAKLTGLALALGAVVMLGTLLVGRWLLAVVLRPDYAEYYPEFLIVVGSQCLGLLISIFGITSTQMKLYWVQVTIHAAVLVTTAAAAWWLITPEAPVRGAAWTFLIRAIAQVLLYAACMGWAIQRRRRDLALAADGAVPPPAIG
ncbi:MAG: hypothetical protein HRU75_10455 [Planctomycetia bacterium]|nr:MAG: hypothetical protein HRU75_10455 [Planctomycetia bacterium]